MSISRVFAAAAIAASFNLGGAAAQSVSQGLVPAEFPPGSYQGRQYVDSDGCVFIRAGIDGNVTWVPRVTRNRKVLCGFKPTFAKAAPAALSAPAQATAPKPVAVATPKPAKPAKRTVVKPVTTIAVQPTVSSAEYACRAGNAVSQQYVGSVGENVRCGPQPGSRAFARHSDGRGASQARYRQAEPRVVPRHVYESQLTSVPGIAVPDGYKPAWDDDRLNPKRAHQTLSGKAQMDQMWTKTLPRRLINRDAGAKVVNHQAGQYVATSQSDTSVTLSTRSTSVKTSGRAASHRYVQAGLFSTQAKANAAARRISGAGLPTRTGRVTYKGKTYLAVLAGPFGTQSQLDRAVQRVRAAGYQNPTLRK